MCSYVKVANEAACRGWRACFERAQSVLSNVNCLRACPEVAADSSTNPQMSRLGEITLFDISWEDVLFVNLVPYLSLKDLFVLRCCSRLSKEFAEQAFSKLKKLNFAGNNTTHIHLVFEIMTMHCKSLEYLNLSGCSWPNDALLIPLLERNNRLKFVSLNGCTTISAVALQPIIIECKQLKVLKLSKCEWLVSGAIDALALHHSNLEEFDISHCYLIGERALVIFFQKFPFLRILNLSYNCGVTDNVLLQIARYCKELLHINLRGCYRISKTGIRALKLNCKKLEILAH